MSIFPEIGLLVLSKISSAYVRDGIKKYWSKARNRILTFVVYQTFLGWRDCRDVVYDLSNTPATYGDYLYAAVLCSQLNQLGFTSRVIICIGDQAKNANTVCWQQEGNNSLAFAEKLKKLSNQILPEVVVKVVHEASLDISKYPFMYRFLLQRSAPIYQIFFNVICELNKTSNSAKTPLSGFLPRESTKSLSSLVGAPFVGVHVRCNVHRPGGRNLNSEEILNIFQILERYLPKSLSVVVFCEPMINSTIRSLTEQMRMRILFSNELSSEVSGQMLLASCSEIYVQIRGGGMSVIPLMSDRPYFICLDFGNESAFDVDRKMAVPWANLTQWFLPYQSYRDSVYDELDLFMRTRFAEY